MLPPTNHESMEAHVDHLLQTGKVDLPVFPRSAQEVLTLCDAKDVDARKLADVIRRDPTLAGNFLAIANSAAFGTRVPLVSLQQALTRLGMLQTKQIAIVIACKTRAFVVPGRPQRAAEILAHALGTAICAQEIARLRRLNVEEAFLCGLLHDIGTPALLQICADVRKANPRLVPPAAAEAASEACAGRLHAKVGAMIARLWSLPRTISDVIEHHHHPDLATGLPREVASAQSSIAIVALADAVVEGKTSAADLADHPAAAILNLYPEDIQNLVAKTGALGAAA
jgi:putative nucleotidyltransferase with HDIG domain